MHPDLEVVHSLTEEGKVKAQKIALAFRNLVAELAAHCPDDRYRIIALESLKEAEFYAKKSMAQKNCLAGPPKD